MALKSINLEKTGAWKALKTHFATHPKPVLANLLAQPNRFENYSIDFKINGSKSLVFDYSKNLLDDTTRTSLIDLARECDLADAIGKLFKGDAINETENRAALHTALREPNDKPLRVNNHDIRPPIQAVLKAMEAFSEKVISGQHKGFSGKAFTDVVNIGIGGSDLGPQMVIEALQYYKKHLNVHFVSNVAGSHLIETLKKLNPETTLFVIVSKTFTTTETLLNADSAKAWLLAACDASALDVAKHFVAASTNQKATQAFGITQTFELWDWVGGRYSLWGAVGLSICLGIGFTHFKSLLAGARAMDMHFKDTPFERNIPVIAALLSILYVNFYGAQSQAILPYDQYLHRLPAFLQQLEMESNGKQVNRKGLPVNYATAPVIWGQPGTNGQHAFFQLLHQGKVFVPADFLVSANSLHSTDSQHANLLAHFLAQTKALAFGKSIDEVKAELKKADAKKLDAEKADADIDRLAPFMVFEGNKPSTSMVYKELTPEVLGSLIALYEHKVFTQGVIWNIFSFDQWGVQLGKQLADDILPLLADDADLAGQDASTKGLIQACKEFQI